MSTVRGVLALKATVRGGLALWSGVMSDLFLGGAGGSQGTVSMLSKIIIIKKTDRTSRQTQAGIGHSAPAHRGGHMQNRISRRQVRRGKIEHMQRQHVCRRRRRRRSESAPIPAIPRSIGPSTPESTPAHRRNTTQANPFCGWWTAGGGRRTAGGGRQRTGICGSCGMCQAAWQVDDRVRHHGHFHFHSAISHVLTRPTTNPRPVSFAIAAAAVIIISSLQPHLAVRAEAPPHHLLRVCTRCPREVERHRVRSSIRWLHVCHTSKARPVVGGHPNAFGCTREKPPIILACQQCSSERGP